METELILSIVIAVATVTYTITTILQVRESRKTRLLKTTPNIIPYLSRSEHKMSIKLYIKNFGEGVAKDVKVKIIKDLDIFNKGYGYLSTVGIAENGLNYFPPNYKMEFFLGYKDKIYEFHKDDRIEMELTYKSLSNVEIKQKFELPLNQILGETRSKPPDTYIGRVAYFLDEIRKELKKTNKELKNKNSEE